jgi:hypothetical protein
MSPTFATFVKQNKYRKMANAYSHTAKMIREDLKKIYPSVNFTVRVTSTNALASEIVVSYNDHQLEDAQVKRALSHYQSSSYDVKSEAYTSVSQRQNTVNRVQVHNKYRKPDERNTVIDFSRTEIGIQNMRDNLLIAIENEDYETAAFIRDALKERE